MWVPISGREVALSYNGAAFWPDSIHFPLTASFVLDPSFLPFSLVSGRPTGAFFCGSCGCGRYKVPWHRDRLGDRGDQIAKGGLDVTERARTADSCANCGVPSAVACSGKGLMVPAG
jgi:hypothetical protein